MPGVDPDPPFPENKAGTRPSPTERLLALALKLKEKAAAEGAPSGTVPKRDADAWRSLPAEDRIIYAMVKGLDDYIEADILELRPKYGRALELVEGPLMKGMQEVGVRFGEGKMFLPQVIRSARVMKKAVAALSPFIEQEKTTPLGSSGDGMPSGGTAESTGGGQDQGSRKILLATVKGDVHDIGKNIVAVVLGCNGYDILDLGVMIPSETILDTAEREGVQIIGLSGLITPSLDEMIRTARDMERRGFTIPLIIGGATTSLAHTALRIAPEYSGPVVHVPDASRSAEVARLLLSETERPRFLEELEHTYREAAERHEQIRARIELVSLEAARKNRIPPLRTIPPGPREKNIRVLNDYPIRRIVPYMDWKGFLRVWKMGGPSPVSPGPGPEGCHEREQEQQKLLEDAGKLLDRIISGDILQLRGVVGFFPARANGDDVLLYDPETVERSSGLETGGELARFCFLRNQEKKRAGGHNPCLADFIAPGKTLNRGDVPAASPERQRKGGPRPGENPAGGWTGDWLGLYVLSAGFGIKEAQAVYAANNDDYGALLLSSLGDCLAEAFTEEVHLRVRREWWGYEHPGLTESGGHPPDEGRASEGPLKGKCQGIRPGFGYPICPDHEDKRILFDLLQAEKRCGLSLTESAMIRPAASVCGMYFAHPGAYYFGVGAVGEDQLQDWAERKGISSAEARRRIGRI
jgi:5-methyltetrahydrofolate--homocysteine methyltransferase